MAEAMDTTEIPAVDEDDRKLFVGGLPQDAQQDDISACFSQFGEIDNINIKTDPATGRSRGFAFVVFKTVEALTSAVDAKQHLVKSKQVAVKKAQARNAKVYVGKLKAELSDEDIKSHFATFGTVVNIEQPYDRTKNERKNFCFVTYEKEEPAKQLLKAGVTTLNGVELEVKKVTPKPSPQEMMKFMGMGRGGGRGGYGGYGYNDPYFASGYGGYDPYGGYGGWGGYPGYGYGGYDGMYGNKTGARGGGARGAMVPGQRGGRGRGGGVPQRQRPY